MRRPKRHYRHMNRYKADWARRMYLFRYMKQSEIARSLGISQSSVSKIISDQVWA